MIVTAQERVVFWRGVAFGSGVAFTTLGVVVAHDPLFAVISFLIAAASWKFRFVRHSE